MRDEDRSAVLYAVASGPMLGLKVGLAYLRMKRAARRAEGQFYRELVRSGLPKVEAKYLAEEYGSAVSIRTILKTAQVRLPEQGRQ